MKQLKLVWFTLAVLGGVLFCAADARAVSYALTGLDYDVGAGRIYGTSQTYLDYNLDPYYNAGVDGYLVKFTSATSVTVLNSGSQNHNNDAVVLTVANVQRGETYGVLSDHFVQTVVYSSGYPYDPYGISRNYFGGSNGNSHYYGFQGAQPAYLQQQWFYLGRTGIIVGLPNITQIAPEAALPGTTAVVQVIGSLLGEHTQRPPAFRVSGNGVTARFSNFLPNGVEIFLDIAEDAETGNHDLIILADPHPHDFPAYVGVPSNTVQFRVGDRTPQIAGITPPEGNTGDQVAVTITGTGFGINPQVQIGGTGVNATINSATPTEIQAVFAVADTTYEGNRDVKVKSNGRLGTGFSPGAGNSDTSNAVGFEVKPLRVSIPPFQVVGKDSTRNVAVQVSPTNNNTPITLTISRSSGSGDAQFSNNQTTIQITRSGNVAIKGITESSVKDNLTLSASLGNASPRSFSVATVKINRTVAGQPTPTDVTDATTPTIVGERINLTASIIPLGINSSSQMWTIPEKIVKGFQGSANQGGSIPVDPLNTADTSFIWVDGGGAAVEDFVSKEVKYDAMIDGQALTSKSTFQVKRPLGHVIPIAINPTTIDTARGNLAIRLGIDTQAARDVGIQFRASGITIPSTFGGEFQWVQIVTGNYSVVDSRGTIIFASPANMSLDGNYPYPPDNPRTASDSPYLGNLPTRTTKVYYNADIDNSSSMWLMFKPSGLDSDWVPLDIVDWKWKVQASNGGFKGSWRITSNIVDPSQSQYTPTVMATTQYPQWSSVVSRNQNLTGF